MANEQGFHILYQEAGDMGVCTPKELHIHPGARHDDVWSRLVSAGLITEQNQYLWLKLDIPELATKALTISLAEYIIQPDQPRLSSPSVR